MSGLKNWCTFSTEYKRSVNFEMSFLCLQFLPKKRTRTHCIVVKMNAFLRFLEEFVAWQFAFEIIRTLIANLDGFFECWNGKKGDFLRKYDFSNLSNQTYLAFWLKIWKFPFSCEEIYNDNNKLNFEQTNRVHTFPNPNCVYSLARKSGYSLSS